MSFLNRNATSSLSQQYTMSSGCHRSGHTDLINLLLVEERNILFFWFVGGDGDLGNRGRVEGGRNEKCSSLL